jgi:hypothetical protein
MIVNICLLVASGADLPVLGFILEFFTGGSVTIFQIITASFAAFQTTIGEVMFFMANTAATVSTACPVIEIIVIPIFAYFVFRGGLLITDTANFLMCILVNIGEIAIGMFACSLDALCGFGTAIGTNHLQGPLVDTGGFLQEFSTFPIVGFGLLKTAFITLAAVLAVSGFLPFAVRMLTCVLDTGLAAIFIDFFAGVRLLAALTADLIFLVRMCRFHLSGVVVVTTGVAGVTGTTGAAAGIVGGTEVEVTNLTLADHNTGTVISCGAGVTFYSVEVITFSVVNKAHMRKAFFEE